MNAVFLAVYSRDIRFEKRRVRHRIEMSPTTGSMIVSSTQRLTDRAAQPPPCCQIYTNAKLRGFMVQFNLLDPPRRLHSKDLLVVSGEICACHLATIRQPTRTFRHTPPRKPVFEVALSFPTRLARVTPGRNAPEKAQRLDLTRTKPIKGPHEFLKRPYVYPIGSACDRTWHIGFVVFSTT